MLASQCHGTRNLYDATFPFTPLLLLRQYFHEQNELHEDFKCTQLTSL